MQRPTPDRIGISSWSTHRWLGKPTFYGPEQSPSTLPAADPPLRDRLLALPAALVEHEISRLQLCHFHLRDASPAYLAELRSELERREVALHALLIDSGDITHPVTGNDDLRWIMSWIPIAAALGAQNIRAIAGKQPYSPDALARSRFALMALADLADKHDISVLIENWFDLLPTGDAVNQLLDMTDGAVALNIDFGNFKRDKYANLEACAARAVSCHAKGDFTAPLALDRADYDRCLRILDAADYDGPYFLIYDDAGSADEWAGIARERDAVLAPR